MSRKHVPSFTAMALTLAFFNPTYTQQAYALDVSGKINIQGGGNGKFCSIAVEGQGTTAYALDCDNDRTQVLFNAVPSTSKVLLSAADCTKSLEKQSWWVELEAKSKSTSSEPLSVQGIVAEAIQWKAGEDIYVAPNIKIIGAAVSNPTSQVGCAAITLPQTGTPLKGFVFNPNPAQNASTGPETAHGICKNGALTRIYSKTQENFDFQCSGPIIRNDGEEFIPDHYATVLFEYNDPPKRCPHNMAVMELLLSTYGARRPVNSMQCSSFISKKTGKILKIDENNFSQRYIENDGHHLMCEGRSQQGQGVSEPENLITGFDLTKSSKQVICSTMTAPE